MDDISPPYTLSSPAPSYSLDPSADEERLAFTHRSRRPRTGKYYTNKSGHITIILREQDDAAQLPSYGRNSLLSGTICIAKRKEISKVTLKVSLFLISVVSVIYNPGYKTSIFAA